MTFFLPPPPARSRFKFQDPGPDRVKRTYMDRDMNHNISVNFLHFLCILTYWISNIQQISWAKVTSYQVNLEKYWKSNHIWNNSKNNDNIFSISQASFIKNGLFRKIATKVWILLYPKNVEEKTVSLLWTNKFSWEQLTQVSRMSGASHWIFSA